MGECHPAGYLYTEFRSSQGHPHLQLLEFIRLHLNVQSFIRRTQNLPKAVLLTFMTFYSERKVKVLVT